MVGKTADKNGRARRRHWPHRPKTAKGWLITLLLAVVAVTLKLTVGAALILALWHLFRTRPLPRQGF